MGRADFIAARLPVPVHAGEGRRPTEEGSGRKRCLMRHVRGELSCGKRGSASHLPPPLPKGGGGEQRASLIIGMALPQAVPHAVGDLEEFRRLADIQRAARAGSRTR